ncbi:MAG TPA: hypothetical protein PKW95_02110 [bacterium]|nr:hypothetical protein [bacterium]
MKADNTIMILLFLLLLLPCVVTCGGDDDDDDSSDDDDATDDDDTMDDDDTDDDDDDTDDDDDDTDDDDDDDTIDDDTDDDDDDDDTVDDDTVDDDDDTIADDFEDDTIGSPPGAPWVVDATGTATATIVSTKTAAGNVLEISSDDPSSIEVSWDNNTDFATSGSVTATFDAFLGSGDQLGFYLGDSSDKGQAFALFGSESVLGVDSNYTFHVCADYLYDTWYQIVIEADLDTQTYSVSVDGDYGDCVDMSWFEQNSGTGGLSGFNIYINASYQGTGRFDNLTVE